MFKIENETDLYYKVVQYIRRFYPEAIIVPGLGELQDTPNKRIDAWEKGYLKGQGELLVLNNHKDYNGFLLEFKNPNNNYKVSEAQEMMMCKCKENGYLTLISNDYDSIIRQIIDYTKGIRLTCPHCNHPGFITQTALQSHFKVIHRIEKECNIYKDRVLFSNTPSNVYYSLTTGTSYTQSFIFFNIFPHIILREIILYLLPLLTTLHIAPH